MLAHQDPHSCAHAQSHIVRRRGAKIGGWRTRTGRGESRIRADIAQHGGDILSKRCLGARYRHVRRLRHQKATSQQHLAMAISFRIRLQFFFGSNVKSSSKIATPLAGASYRSVHNRSRNSRPREVPPDPCGLFLYRESGTT